MSPVRQAPRALSDPSSRARYVAEVLALLFPETPGPATKLGVNGLTRRLVLAETTALTTLRHLRLSTVVTPRVLYAGRWRRHQVLVQEALPAWHRRYPDRHRMVAAMREVAGCLGVSYAPLSASGYWKVLQE